jgi:ketosteroid isomerase-like protein
MATTREIGKRLVDLCNQMKNLDAVNELYADNIVSIDAHGDEKMPRRMEGKQAVLGKNKWFFDMHEIHSSKASGPMLHDDRFAVYFTLDCTPKDGPFKGKRMKMEEVGLYEVKDGKIVKEEFFYDMGG